MACRPAQYALLGIGAPDVPLDQLEPKLVKSFKLTSTLSVEGVVLGWHTAAPVPSDRLTRRVRDARRWMNAQTRAARCGGWAS